jgi:D-alanyl-lipoteichoic acid acyltransferase DltB (MBOAT superfamily)
MEYFSYKQKFLSVYYEYENKYKQYAKMRGFKSFNDRAYHQRGFIECWAEPGFHRFWQIWNPGISFFVHCLFIKIGGRKHWVLPTFFSFLMCGIMHTLIVFPFFNEWSFSVIIASICFGLLTILSRKLSNILKQNKWPIFINIIVNLSLVIISFDIGFKIDRIIY